VYTNTEIEAVSSDASIGQLTVQKTVTANSDIPGSILNNTDFTFTVTLKTKDDGGNYVAYTGPTKDDEENGLQAGKIKYVKGEDTGALSVSDTGTVTFTLKNGESIALSIPTGIHYTVTESAATGFSITRAKDTTGTITGTHTAAITNTYNNSYRLYVKKVWDDESHANHRTEVTFDLIKTVSGNSTIEWTQNTSSTADWSGYYTRNRYEGGNLVTYSVDETSTHEGYTKSYSQSGDTITITNTYNESLLSTLTVTKVVDGSAPDTAKEFPFTVTISDKAYDGTPTVGGDSSRVAIEKTDTGTVFTFTLKHGETVTIPALYSGTTYKVEEGSTTGYALKEATGSYSFQDGKGTLSVDLTAVDGVFSGKIENTPNSPYSISLTYTNKATSSTNPDPTPTPTPKPSTTITEPKDQEPPDETETPDEPASSDVSPSPEVTEAPDDAPANSLPQTGTGWYPVALLALAGLAAISAGTAMWKKRRDR
jgi:LPXTG-motif cell wall-anchored protein